MKPGSRSVSAALGRSVLVALACVAILAVSASTALARPTFDPAYVLSDAKLRDVDSLNESGVQAFLDQHPGVLKSLVTADHSGTPKRASAIIIEACRQWRISPKVMLALLQKENSLISNPNPSDRVLSRAIGAGCPNAVENRYPGFGNQIWNGARMLDGYGEGKTTSYIPMWSSGKTCDVSEGSVTPSNIATFKLYTYNPVIGADRPYGDLTAQAESLHGNASFWHVYWRYFGDPLGGSSTPKRSGSVPSSGQAPPVSRWKPQASAGQSVLSTSQILSMLQSRLEARPRQRDTISPVFRFFLVDSGAYVYTDSKTLCNWLRGDQNRGQVKLDGVVTKAIR